jgi:predicted permease
MAIIGEWIRRLGYLLRRRALEDELRREMEAHRALMEDPRAFGNTLRLQEEARDVWGWRWLDDFAQDTRFALRTLRHSPGFTLTAIVTLAFGIGVNSGMFSIVNGLLLRPLYERSDEVVTVVSRSTAPAGGYRGVSYPNYLDLREGTTEIFANLAAFSTRFVGLDAGEGTRRTMASAVTANYFDVFGRPLALGRPFTNAEERLDVHVAIISYALWARLGADSGMLGRSVRINSEPFTVIGVTAQGFSGPSIPGPDVWLPIDPVDARDAHELIALGRLRTGTRLETVAPALVTVARRLEQAFPAINGGYTLEMSAPSRLLFFPGPASGVLTATLGVLLMIMPVIVLLVACLNLANLLLARGHARRRELAIKSSLGGSRGRITRQLLTEGMLLALAGGAIGLLLSTWATKTLLTSVGSLLPVELNLPEFGLDWRVLAGTAAFSLLASLVFSASTAWTLTGRAAVTDLQRYVGEQWGRPRGVGVSNRMAVEQVALSLLLLTSGGLFMRSASSATTADPGFPLDRALLVEIDPGLAGYDESRGRQAHLAMVDRLRTVPGVDAVTIASGLPFSGTSDSRFVAPAGVADARSRSVDSVFTVIGRDYARALGLSMLGGRDFTDAELAPGSSEPVAIVDDALAERLWPAESALGRLIQFLDAEGSEVGKSIRVVGIVPAVKHSFGNARPFPHVYVPLGQRYESAMTLQLRLADEDAERVVRFMVADIVRSVDERVPVLHIETWRDHLNAGSWFYRAGAVVFSAFGGIALMLAVIGVYGVKSYVVSCRTREFGIRLAVGAHPRALLWQVLREGSRTTITGIAIGLLLALGAGQLLQRVLYGVHRVEPVVLIAASLILLGSSLLASYVPALRATKVDPNVALRSE